MGEGVMSRAPAQTEAPRTDEAPRLRADEAPRLQTVEVAVLGSGFAGIAMAAELHRDGRTDFVVLERASEVGGTWRDNTYPGAACDVPSHLYSFSFAPNPAWSHSFSRQPQIQDYLCSVVDELGIRPYLRLGHEVTAVTWDSEHERWDVETSRGRFSARIVIAATGALSEPSTPTIPGLDEFEGTVFHSARWRHKHDLAGENVAVIGTGASAIQFVPKIQPTVRQLTLFQRTAPWVMPRHDRPIARIEQRLYRRFPAYQRLARSAIYWGREVYAVALTRNTRLLALPQRIAARHLERQVPDPELRANLTPTYTIGCKRILISNDYYPALTRPNVSVETERILRVRERSIVTEDGTEHPVDTIIFGTGFKVTDPAIARMLRGRDGRLLAEEWAGGMRAHRGSTIPGFPNFFLMVGPNTGLGHTSQVYMIEQQVMFIAEALRLWRNAHAATIEVRLEAVDADETEIQQRMKATVWTTGGCASWYLDPRGRNTVLWPDFTFKFASRLRTINEADYVLAGSRAPAPSTEAA